MHRGEHARLHRPHRDLEQLGDARVRQALDHGEVEHDREGRLRLTARGESRIRRDALELVFRGLTRTEGGEHRTPTPGPGLRERLAETRPYRFGDDLADLPASIQQLNTHCETLATEKLIPDLLTPITQHIGSNT